jgi:hypothetical protein
MRLLESPMADESIVQHVEGITSHKHFIGLEENLGDST